MVLKGDYASIAGTTAGVSGTISVPSEARLFGINLNFNTIAGGVRSVEVTWAGAPKPLKFVPQMGGISTGAGAALAMCDTPMIDLRGLVIGKANTVTITLTTAVNLTVVVGLMWVE